MRTRFGRHVYAVGGNAEAARRAGINVPRIRTIVFVISSGMAAIGGIILAVQQDAGLAWVLVVVVPVVAVVFMFIMRGAVPLFQVMQTRIDEMIALSEASS